MKTNKPLELESSLEMNTEENSVRIFITTTCGSKLKAQDVLDAVTDMLFTYYGVTSEEWSKMSQGTDFDS